MISFRFFNLGLFKQNLAFSSGSTVRIPTKLCSIKAASDNRESTLCSVPFLIANATLAFYYYITEWYIANIQFSKVQRSNIIPDSLSKRLIDVSSHVNKRVPVSMGGKGPIKQAAALKFFARSTRDINMPGRIYIFIESRLYVHVK